MKITIEILSSLILICLGYVSACVYLKNDCLKPFKLNDITVNTKSRLIYIIFAVVASAGIITLFNTLYASNSMVHCLKLLTLIECIIPMAAVDHRKHKIPNQFLLFALGLRVVFYIIEFIISVSSAFDTLKDNAIGAAVIGVFFLLISLVFKNSIGMGDIKLFAIMGLYQGLWGAFNSVFFSLLVSFFLAIGLLITRKKKRKDAISFGPSILLGTIIAIGLSGI